MFELPTFAEKGWMNKTHIWLEKQKKRKEKHIHTFAMVFPPLQEAT